MKSPGTHKPQKVMILIWNMGIGGIQKRVKDIIIDLTTNAQYRGTEVYLVVTYQQSSFFIDEVRSKADPKNLKIIFYSEYHQKSKSLPTFYWLFKQYLTIKPTALLTFLDYLSVFAILLKLTVFWQRCRVILNEGVLTSRYLKLNRPKSWRLWSLLITFCYRFAHTIIVPSKAVRNDLTQHFFLPATKIKIIPNWTLFKSPLKPITKKFDLAFIGRFETEKDPLSFLKITLEVIKKYPQLQVCMIGSGKLESDIINFISDHHLQKHVQLLPPENNVNKVLAQTKLLVVTSKNEGLPNVVLEAGALGVPTVSTPFIGVDEVILTEKTGWVRDSQLALVATIVDLLKHPSRLTKAGQNAQQHIQRNFSYQNQSTFIDTLLRA